MNLSVSHPLDSSPGRRALGKEVSFSMKLICVCWKTSRNAKASPYQGRWHAAGVTERFGPHHLPKPPLLGEVARRSRDGEVVQSSTCVIPLTLKASFVQPLRRLRRQLSWQESPWQRGFVFDETDLRLLENVTECQSLPY